jgi:acid phosphatase
MPADGDSECNAYPYARKHNPWVNFNNVPNTANLRFSRFPVDFTTLPTIAMVVPNLCNDMHDCPIATGDAWLENNIDAYVQWASAHNSLLILIWDEDDSATAANRIPLVFAGAEVKVGYTSTATLTHYNVLRTLEDMYALAPLSNAATAAPITDVWVDDRIFADNFD